MKHILSQVILTPLKVIIVLCGIYALTGKGTIHLVSAPVSIGGLIVVVFLVWMVLLDAVENIHNRRRSKPETEMRQSLREFLQVPRTLWKTKNLLFTMLGAVYLSAVVPPSFRWLSANANAANALATMALVALTAISIFIAGLGLRVAKAAQEGSDATSKQLAEALTELSAAIRDSHTSPDHEPRPRAMQSNGSTRHVHALSRLFTLGRSRSLRD